VNASGKRQLRHAGELGRVGGVRTGSCWLPGDSSGELENSGCRGDHPLWPFLRAARHRIGRLLIDPGTWSEGFENLTGLDAVLITHQYVDHLDGERMPVLLRRIPGVRLIVDSGSAAQLSGHNPELAAPGEILQVAGARVEVLGGDPCGDLPGFTGMFR
jgi:hypothetical protein